ncbi:hypothetical protein IKF15_03750 [Candidatus Saccharibacteria bacterium]|nr:hypothetical protein [Candidatus Saccharibacteria bacterium]
MKRQEAEFFDKLMTRSADEIIADLQNGVSLLEIFKCGGLKRKMSIVGAFGRLGLKIARRRTKMDSSNPGFGLTLRHETAKLIEDIAPLRLLGRTPRPKNGLVIGFNHPSLGEVLRIIAICCKKFPRQRYLFPVTISYYEALLPMKERCEQMGFFMAPIVTPKMSEIFLNSSPEHTQEIERLRSSLNSHYLQKCCDFIENGDIVVLAPSAQRQETVFNSLDEMTKRKMIEPATMSLLATALRRKLSRGDYSLVSLAVKKPQYGGKGMNFGRCYDFCFGKMIQGKTAQALARQRYEVFDGKKRVRRGRLFDYLFLTELARTLEDMGASGAII